MAYLDEQNPRLKPETAPNKKDVRLYRNNHKVAVKIAEIRYKDPNREATAYYCNYCVGKSVKPVKYHNIALRKRKFQNPYERTAKRAY